ncbi:MAG: hypothetical protein CMJ18_04340 [Phycisphaeraceae bacterium]|nr:hypothetical protein [Phycisphaeraceae bacterium]
MSSEPPPIATPPAPAVDALLEGLTEPQRQAVLHVEGPLQVLAGPGSGKTRVITRRIAHLVLGVGLAPWNVLAITFTNKAANEMRERAGAMLSPKQARAVTLTTFHSFCARMLRRYADRLGLPAAYSIYDAADQTRAVKQALSDLNMSSSNFPPANVRATISEAKNELIDDRQFAANALDFYSRSVAKAYTKYQAILNKSQAVDFDDLLMLMVRLIQGHADVVAELRDVYQYVLVDEYQDTNRAQFAIARGLAGERGNLCVTGDPDQSIYSWRGADIRNILDFEKHYPSATTIRLEQNFRSTKRILSASDALIQRNTQRKHKALWTENESGTPVQVIRCDNEHEESQRVVDRLQAQYDREQVSWRDMAVFYRANHLSRTIEEALRNSGIPYQIARGTAFYDRKEIKDVIAYLRVVANPADEVNLLRVINTPARGISERTVKALQVHAEATGAGVRQLLADPTGVSDLNPRALAAIARFDRTLAQWQRLISDPMQDALRVLVERVFTESGIEAFYRQTKNDPEAERIDNLGELISSAQQFDDEYDFQHADDLAETIEPKLQAYLEQVSLVSDVDAVKSDDGVVTLMTLHAAKGLEYPVVAMIGVEEGLLPHRQSIDSDDALEEERRLCFVGMTRARRILMMSHTRCRTVFGQTLPAIPSRFLRELPEDELEITGDEESEASWDRPSRRRREIDAPAGEASIYTPGTMVRHPQFGLGRIIRTIPSGNDARVRVRFANVGEKTLVLSFARLEVVS